MATPCQVISRVALPRRISSSIDHLIFAAAGLASSIQLHCTVLPYQYTPPRGLAAGHGYKVLASRTVHGGNPIISSIFILLSDYRLGAVRMQDDYPLAFYSRKLNSAQKGYATGKQELLSIVETLKNLKIYYWVKTDSTYRS